jgi:hypothetical protein
MPLILLKYGVFPGEAQGGVHIFWAHRSRGHARFSGFSGSPALHDQARGTAVRGNRNRVLTYASAVKNTMESYVVSLGPGGPLCKVQFLSKTMILGPVFRVPKSVILRYFLAYSLQYWSIYRHKCKKKVCSALTPEMTFFWG